MAFNTLEYLSEGKIDFMVSINFNDKNSLINNVRESSNKINIIKGFLPKLIDIDPLFCLSIIYDTNEFEKEAKQLLNIYPKFLNCTNTLISLSNNTTWGTEYIISVIDSLDINRVILNASNIFNLVNNTTWGKEYIVNNISNLNDKLKSFTINLLLSNFNENMEYLKQLSIHKDLHTRFIFMKNLINYAPDKINIIYDDITKYLTNYTPQEFEQPPILMDASDISELAVLFYNNKEIYNKIITYIFNNYDKNDVAKHLDQYGYMSELENNIDSLFLTSRNFQFELLKKYSSLISKDIIENYLKYISYFKKDKLFENYTLEKIFKYELYPILKELVDKYLSLSLDDTYKYLGSGTTCQAHKIGDYTFKLVNAKWSYEDVICPNLFLILKNLEELYIRDNDNIVITGIEVQQYLKRTTAHLTVDEKINLSMLFNDELKKAGYWLNDQLINGQCGENGFFLDSYKDADTKNPEELPEWFKKDPIVLVDRDRVYKLENKFPKQLSSRY